MSSVLGEIHLTYKEALDTEEEVYGILDEEFDELFFKPALEVVHHDIGNLDDIVKKVWEKFHQEMQVRLFLITWSSYSSCCMDNSYELVIPFTLHSVERSRNVENGAFQVR